MNISWHFSFKYLNGNRYYPKNMIMVRLLPWTWTKQFWTLDSIHSQSVDGKFTWM